jgi:glycine/D-amino acid oxidase-like deaminating enzyme
VRYADQSFWLEQVGEELTPRPALEESIECDVAIVGAGFTGLWTAYYLQREDPTLRIAVLEREIAGFGASGRNGGWCSALFPVSSAKVAALGGSSSAAAFRMAAAMRDTVDEVGKVAATEGIDCHYSKGGTITLARTPAQWKRARRTVAEARTWGADQQELRLLDERETREYVRATAAVGATYTPHCARIQPARLARGLARLVERRGAAIYERTPVSSLAPSLVTTARGRVRASTVIRATEGYTAGLAGMRRSVVPVYSLVVATEPLSPTLWDAIGLDDNPTFSDFRHLLVYGQRTADGRLVFGGRGAPYHFGSEVRAGFERVERVFRGIREHLVELFPALNGVAFTHAWGGPLAIPRDWTASVGYDDLTGLGWAGGYVGDGVATTNLAGRTLADLVLHRQTELTTLPWVNHRSRRWEPEPLRWLGINTGLRAMALADLEERVTRRESVLAKAMSPLVGGH